MSECKPQTLLSQSFFQKISRKKSINLINFKIDSTIFNQIIDMVEKRRIHTLRLVNIAIVNDEGNYIKGAFERLFAVVGNLQSFELSVCDNKNNITNKSIEHIVKILKDKKSRLVKLTLRLNLINDIISKKIAESLKRNTVLKSLNLSNNEISDNGVIEFLKNYDTMYLTSLDLSGNVLSAKVVEAFKKGFEKKIDNFKKMLKKMDEKSYSLNIRLNLKNQRKQKGGEYYTKYRKYKEKYLKLKTDE